MTIFEVYLSLIDLYNKSHEDNSPFFEKVVGNLRISVTHKQALVLDLSVKTVVCMLLDTSQYKGELKHQFLFGGNTSNVQITGKDSKIFSIAKMLPMYLMPGTIIEEEEWNLDDITEDFHFQQNTLTDIPEYKYFEQVQKHFRNIEGASRIWKVSVIMDMCTDWDNIPLTKEDFQ